MLKLHHLRLYLSCHCHCCTAMTPLLFTCEGSVTSMCLMWLLLSCTHSDNCLYAGHTPPHGWVSDAPRLGNMCATTIANSCTTYACTPATVAMTCMLSLRVYTAILYRPTHICRYIVCSLYVAHAFDPFRCSLPSMSVIKSTPVLD